MARVTIEGSTTMATSALGRGQRMTVEYTDHIRKLVRIGAVTIVDGPTEEEPKTIVEQRRETLAQMQSEEDGPLDAAHNKFPPPRPPVKRTRGKAKATDGEG